MDDYAGRVLADRYRLPLPPSDAYEFAETRAFDTYSGQEVLVRQVPLPEVVEAEVLDDDGGGVVPAPRRPSGRTTRRPTDPAVRRAIEAAQAAAQIPDHPRLDQVFDVFAEGGSLWIVSEVVAARPLAALLAEKPLPPYRAAEVASDVLTALRALHAHGWVHRNITVRTVLVCDDGRIMLTGLAAGAAEDALCGYDPVPDPPLEDEEFDGSADAGGEPAETPGAADGELDRGEPGGSYGPPAAGAAPEPDEGGGEVRPALPAGDTRAARAGAIAAYRAGARAAAAARVREEQEGGAAPALPGPRAGGELERGRTDFEESGAAWGGTGEAETTGTPGRIADPYGVAGRPGGRHDPGRASARVGTQARDQPSIPPGEQQPRYQPPRHLSERSDGGAPASSTGMPALPVAARQGAAEGSWPSTARAETAGAGARWDDVVAGGGGPRRKGPATPLDAERARQARMTVVGAVTERWSPEQAGPVHENWQLAPPIGPATDLWALGALLFRAVQGHAPYPEDSTYELVQLVCAESPAFAEECGPLRPVVESLLRQDPTERPDFEELRGWLRSLIRSAPEPEAGEDVVPVLPGSSRLPVVRRRGELVRRRRGEGGRHGRHKRGRPPKEPRARREKPARLESAGRPDEVERAPKPPREPGGGGPRRLGRTLLTLILLALVGAVVYAVMFMPKADSQGGDDAQGAGSSESAPAGEPSEPAGTGASQDPEGSGKGDDEGKGGDKATPGSQKPDPQTTDPDVAKGFALRKDPEGFQVAVAKGWDRQGKNGSGQVSYSKGEFELMVVPGRDTAKKYGKDPMAYQRDKERELQPFRDSSWSTSTGMRRIDVGDRVMAEGQFTWEDGGDEVFVRNLAMIVDGRYHVVMVKGPEAQRDEVSKFYEQASGTYRAKS